MKNVCSLLLLICLFVTSAFGGVYHVSKEGNDSHSGTKGSPFKTLTKASEVLEPGDTCIVHAGVYRECFKPKNSGTSEKTIRLMAAEGDKVVLSGMEAMNDWQPAGDGIFKTQASWDLGVSNFVLIDNKMGFEARFPNKTNDNPLDIEGGEIIEEGVTNRPEGTNLPSRAKFKSEAPLPENCTSENLSSANLWVLAQRKWSAWIAPVTGYDAKERLIGFKGRVSSNYNPNWVHNDYGRNIYYMFGSKVLLDVPNEWYFDKQAKELYVIINGRRKPAAGQVEFRKRALAIDLRGRTFWEVSGFEIKGAAIDMSNVEGCTLDRCNISYFWHSSAMNVRSSGIVISGKHNVIKNCSIAYSAGGGITLSGESNTVANNLVHHCNYLGSISTGALRISGFNHRINYNTIHTTGRDLVKLYGAGCVIAWNHLYDPGVICYDLGAIYSGGTDYQNTLIHHNLVHNDNQGHPFNGIYFDNYTNNGIVHHNVVWGNIKSGVRLNRPGNYHQVFNNTTVSIDNRYGPWEGPATQFGSCIVNNYISNPIMANEEAFQANNVDGFPFNTQERKPLETESAKGFGKCGFPDYVGAFSNKSENWAVEAGHDFSRPSIPPVSRELPFMRNYIRNGSFDWGRNRSGELTDIPQEVFWEETGQVELRHSGGFHRPSPTIRKSVHANSLLLKSSDAGISQTVKGLKPDSFYKIGVYVRTYEQAEIILSVQASSDRKEISSEEIPVTAGWKFLALPFQAGPQDTEVTVQIRKTGDGDVYLDNIGLVPDLPRSQGGND